MVKHLLSVTEWGHLPPNPSDEQLLRVARDTVYRAEMAMMDKAKAHPVAGVKPVGYTLCVVLGTTLDCRDEPHDGVEVPDRPDPGAEGDQ
jgi:hypothetical protein